MTAFVDISRRSAHASPRRLRISRRNTVTCILKTIMAIQRPAGGPHVTTNPFARIHSFTTR